MQIQSVVPGQCAVGCSAEVLAADEAALRAVSDPWERARLAASLVAELQRRSAVALAVRREAVHELVVLAGAARSRVARWLGLTPSRIGQLLAAARPEGGVR